MIKMPGASYNGFSTEIGALAAGTADVKGSGTSGDMGVAAVTGIAGIAVVCDGARADIFSASFAGIAATLAEILRALFSSGFWTRGTSKII